MAPGLALPYGFKDAKVLLLIQSIIGDFLQGKDLKFLACLQPGYCKLCAGAAVR
jgi:hypothetical protein